MKIAVAIPVYKSNLNDEERVSLKRCLIKLGLHKCFLICPTQFNKDEYEKVIAETGVDRNNIQFLDFPGHFFSSIDGYNKLMLNPAFYQTFSAFNYLLIYQLDSYIFQDSLVDWCNKNYDYVGAPWINWEWSVHYARSISWPRRIRTKLGFTNYNLVGNGGFSLRKISSFIQNLNLFKKQAECFKLNEDYFFSFFVTTYNPFFKIPDYHEALKFSFDENPHEAYLLNEKMLPMGCHGWPKYKSFWSEFISLEK